MCEQCESKNPPLAAKKTGRIKLWQLPRHLHCPIVGTCLSMEELRKVQRQSGLLLPPDHSDYHLHASLVMQAEVNDQAARCLHKLLERKYARWVKAYGRLDEAQQREAFWSQALREGEISGPFWALLSHHASESGLVERAVEDVHMLSHLQGAANRADLRRTAQLEREVAQLQQALEQAREDHQKRLADQQALIAAQEKALAAMRQQLRPCSETEQQLIQERLTQQLEESRKHSRLLAKRQEWTAKQLAQREVRLTELEHGQQGLIEQLRETQQERDALESAVSALLEQQHPDAREPLAVDLQGRHVAYIGGRASLYPRLRALVEAHNGQLSHHDGGVEDSRAELGNRLSSADLVFCPIDCVSHDACLKVKRFCKRHEKTFVPLRSASLSAFSGGLKAVSEQLPN